MNRIIRKVRTVGYYLIALLVVGGHPLVAMADTPQATTDSTVSAPASSTSSSTAPATVTTNPPSAPAPSTVAPTTTTTPTTPATSTPPKTTPAPDSPYTFDPTTQKWSNAQWQYNPVTGKYEAVQPVAPTTTTPTTSTPSTTSTAAPSAAAPLTTSSTPSGSSDPTTPTTQSTTNANTTASLLNALTSTANTGDAGVLNNTAAGSATSGNAAAAVTLVNQVNSSLAAGSNQKVVQFTKNIMGDVNGDITLYPLLLKAMLEQKAGDPTASATVNSNDQLNATNTIGVNAQSGNATVSGNTSAGNATSGSADAVANVVNILNSMIATQQSFIGTINIYGNLNGDILVAPDFIPQMLANNASNSSASPADTSTNVSSSDTQSIVNNISAIANSGAASVLNNTTSGSATTGAANTNVLLFNLTGHQVIAKDSILVFVNVLGHWVGMIVGAPAGATSAMIADGVTENQTTPDLTVNAAAVHGITNNIAVTATSGNANVSDNTKAGNATSGNASAAVNLANISNSDLSFSGWFGIIFINVFQNWFGSFGIDTPYGNPATTDMQSSTAAPTAPIQFVPHTSNTVKTHAAPVVLYDGRLTNTQSSSENNDMGSGVVLASASVDPSSQPQKLTPAKIPASATSITNDYRLWVVVGSVTLMGISAVGLRRLLMH